MVPQNADAERCRALVPIKCRDQGKSRLACLTAEARARLVQLMLEAVLLALRSSQRVGRIAVISTRGASAEGFLIGENLAVGHARGVVPPDSSYRRARRHAQPEPAAAP